MRFLRLALLLGACLSSAVAQDTATILKKVNDHYNHLASLQTRYTEHYAGMGMDRTESGTLLLKKPGRMRWSYDTPPGKIFVLDGKAGWFYTPGDAQAQRISLKKIDDLRSPLRLLLGHTQLQKELDQVMVQRVATGFRISGVPRGPQGRTRSLALDVDETGTIRAILIEEADGAHTSFAFSETRENVAPGAGAFVFQPPPGVAVVEGLPPI